MDIFMIMLGLLFILLPVIGIGIEISSARTNQNKFMLILIGSVFIIVGSWMAWPLVVLLQDWVTGEHNFRPLLQHRRQLREAANTMTYVGNSNYLLWLNLFVLPLLFRALQKDPYGSKKEAWMLLLIVGTINLLALGAYLHVDKHYLLPLPVILLHIHTSIINIGYYAYLLYWCLIWMGGITIRLLTGFPLGPIAAAFMPLAAFPFYYGSDHHLAWYWQVPCWFGSVILGIVVNAIRDIENDRWNELLNKEAERVLQDTVQGNNNKPFTLYLRSFRATGTLDTQSGQQGEALDLETILSKAVSPQQFIALGSTYEINTVGAGRIYTSNENWWTTFQSLATKARSIFLTPSLNEGTLREINWLFQQNMFAKTIIIMPPMRKEGDWQTNVYSSTTVQLYEDRTVDQGPLWQAIQQSLAKKPGIQLPDYNPVGMLIKIDNRGKVERRATIDIAGSLMKVRRLRMAIRGVE
jgi:hypothetical protein